MLYINSFFCTFSFRSVHDLLPMHHNDPLSRLDTIFELHRVLILALAHAREVEELN